MKLPPPRSTRTDTLFPDTRPCRSNRSTARRRGIARTGSVRRRRCYQLRSPVEPGVAQEGLGELVAAMFGEHGIDPRLCGGIRRSASRPGDRAVPALEEPVHARRLKVISAPGAGPRSPRALAGVAPESRSELADP